MGNNQQGDSNMKKHTYIQEYSIRGGMDEHADEETKCSSIMVKGDNPEQELWDMVLNEIRGGYEQRLFVNDFDYDIVGGDDSIAELREEGMEAFKKDHNIDKITSMGYYDDAWSGWMSDQTVYRIEDRIEKPTVEQIKDTVLRYLDEKFENTRVIDDYRDTVVEGLQARYTNKEELRADIERIFAEGKEFYEPEE
jgi:hypothetical protein